MAGATTNQNQENEKKIQKIIDPMKYSSIQVLKYSRIQVFKYLSKEFTNGLLLTHTHITYNVKTRDPIGSNKHDTYYYIFNIKGLLSMMLII